MSSETISNNIVILRTLGLKVRQDLLDLYPGTYNRRNLPGHMHCLPDGSFRFFDEDFTGACGVASYMLSLLARKRGIDLDWVGHAHHFWNEYEGHIVDATYSQFDEKCPVWVGFETSRHTPGRITLAKDSRWISGIYRNERAKFLARRFPVVQNPLSKYHAPVIQKWLGSLDR